MESPECIISYRGENRTDWATVYLGRRRRPFSVRMGVQIFLREVVRRKTLPTIGGTDNLCENGSSQLVTHADRLVPGIEINSRIRREQHGRIEIDAV